MEVYYRLKLKEIITLIYIYVCVCIYIYIYFSKHMEKAMAPHSSTLAWKIPWMEDPW